MPTLEWIGKEKVINHHQSVPFRTLERQYSFDEAGQHDEDNGSENMVIHGDNLEALKALLPRYEGRVKCISAVATGAYATLDEASAHMSSVAGVYDPNRSLADTYARKYAMYVKSIELLDGLWDELQLLAEGE